MREISDRAEALQFYVSRQKGLWQAHNRLAGIIALAERRIGTELRQQPRARPGRKKSVASGDRSLGPPTLATKDQSAKYQKAATVGERVILDAIAVRVSEAKGRPVPRLISGQRSGAS